MQSLPTAPARQGRRPRTGAVRIALLAGLALSVAGCSQVPRIGGGVSPGDTGVRIQGDTTIIEDAAGPTLIIDGDGCQTVVPANGPPELVRDADGAPVCLPG